MAHGRFRAPRTPKRLVLCAGPQVATACDYWSGPVATHLLLGSSSTRNGMREEERDMRLADVANAWCAWLHVSSRMRRSPVCLFDIRREYSAFDPFAFLLQASLPSFSEFVRNRVPGAAQSFTYQYLCEITTSHTLIRCTLESWNQSHTATISVKRTLEFIKRYVNNQLPMPLFCAVSFTGRQREHGTMANHNSQTQCVVPSTLSSVRITYTI